MPKQSIYTVGGTVQAGGGIYIKRKADDDLLDLCRQGEFAFILSSRQVGKSSLMVRTAQQLEKEDICSVIIDLSAIGTSVSQDEWYLGILNEIYTTLNLETDIFAWWSQYSQLGSAQRLTSFFKDVLLKEVKRPVVLFFDEIDSTLSIPFSDDFYIALRSVYNARSITPDFKRLCFVMVGVAAPSDLISDSKRTPFNIGHRVEINDFTLTEALPLAQGLGDRADQVLPWILHYTGGHPYLTQRLCAYLASSKEAVTEQVVAEAVEKLYTGDRGKQDNNLQFVRDMLSKRSPDATRVLLIYRDIRAGKKVRDDERSIAKAHLKLSGLVRSEQGGLHVRNEIYNTVFNSRWVNENIPRNWTKIAALSLGFATLLLLSVFIYDFVVGIENERYRSKIYGSDPSVQLENLARIFDLRGFLPNSDYDSSAREVFFSLKATEQEALFNSSSPDAKGKYLTTVVRGLYVTLANVEGAQDSHTLLQIIRDSLKNVDANLYNEIDLWLQARDAATDQDALAKYNEAIQMNGDNPATHYERAAVEIKLGLYEQALLNLNTTMALAQNLSTEAAEKEIPTPAPRPSATFVLPTNVSITSTAPNIAETPKSVVTSTAPTIPPAEIEPTATTSLDQTPLPNKTPIIILTPEVQAAPILQESYRSNFFSRAYIRSAVDLLIQKIIKNPDSLILFQSNDYPDLASNGLLPSVLLTPTVAGTDLALDATLTDQSSRLTQAANPSTSPTLGGTDKIAFVANHEIWMMNADASGLTQLTVDGATKNDLQWLDQDTLLFLSGKTIETYKLSVDSVDTLTIFPSASSLDAFQVSHDGKQVMIAMDNEIFVVPFDVERFRSIQTRADLIAMPDSCILPTAKTMAALQVQEARWSSDDQLVAWLYKGADSSNPALLSEIVSVFNVQDCNPETITLLDTFPGIRFVPQGYQDRQLPDFDWDGFDQFVFNTSRRNDGWGELYIYNWQTHNAILINPIEGSCCYRDARWSPDGTFLFFAFQDVNLGASAPTLLYLLPTDEISTGSNFQPIPLPDGFFRDAKEAPQPALRPSEKAVSISPELSATTTQDISATAQKIAFVVDNQIWTMNLDGSALTQLTFPPGLNNRPDWSPDGKKLVFVSTRDGSNPEIYSMNADGSGQTRLTFDDLFSDKPAWSPDGLYIAFSNERQIYIMFADGSNQIRLTSNGDSDDDPDWSPDGTHIVFESNRDGDQVSGIFGGTIRTSDIYEMNVDGTAQTRLTDEPAVIDFSPSWSPDGNHIAFVSQRDGNNEVYLMNPDGSGQRNLTNNPVDDSDPAWSPDSAMIIYTSRTTGTDDIYIMRLDGTIVRRLTNNDIYDIWPIWQP